jgi:hypothetical protein
MNNVPYFICFLFQDISISLLKKVLQKIEQIKKSRAGPPNFESHDVESSDLQLSIGQYIQLRGTTKVRVMILKEVT